MTEIDRILDQLKRAFEGQSWHGPSIKELLNGVTAEQACQRPLANAHSIWESVHHIAVWEDVVLRLLQGDPAEVPISSPEDWLPTENACEAALGQVNTAVERSHQALVDAS